MKTIKDYIGKTFIYIKHPNTVYTVQGCVEDLVKISWDGGDVHYGLSEVMRLFAEGAWEFIESPKLKINIHPTDNPSRLFLSDNGKELNLSGYPLRNYTTGQHIYITSSEKIVLDDYGLGFAHGIKGAGRGHFVFKQDGTNVGKINALCADARKIVLTTNQELIDKGIQPINDDFLFWFVNNPSCEEVDFLRCPIEGLYTLITQDETDHLLSTLANKKRLMEDVTKIEYEYIGECNGNNGNGCFLDSCGQECGCFIRQPKQDKTYTEQEVKDLLEMQRGNCYVALLSHTKNDDIASVALGAPEPGGKNGTWIK